MSALHQLAGWLGVCGSRGLRHDAVRRATGRHDLHGHRRIDGRNPARRWRGGHALSLPNTRVLIHQPSGGFSGQATDIQIHAQEILRVRRRLDEILAHHTGKPIEVVNHDSDRDFFMSAEEAKDYGLIDEIIQGRIKSGGAPNGESSNGGRPPGAPSETETPQAGGGATRTRNSVICRSR